MTKQNEEVQKPNELELERIKADAMKLRCIPGLLGARQTNCHATNSDVDRKLEKIET